MTVTNGWTYSEFVGDAGGWFKAVDKKSELVVFQIGQRWVRLWLRLADASTIAEVFFATRDEALVAA